MCKHVAQSYRGLCKLFDVFAKKVVDGELAFVLQHEDRNSDGWFRHRSDPEDGALFELLCFGSAREADGGQVGDAGGGGDQGDCAGDLVLVDHLLHGGGDLFVVLASVDEK